MRVDSRRDNIHELSRARAAAFIVKSVGGNFALASDAHSGGRRLLAGANA